MIRDEIAAELAKDLAVTFGIRDQDRIERYSGFVADAADCEICARRALDRLARDAERMPSPRSVRRAILDEFDTGHGSHFGAAEEGAAQVEAFWRTDAANVIAEVAGLDDLTARFLAARMWASQAVPAEVSTIREEVEGDLWSGPWLTTLPPVVDAELVEFAFAHAHRVAIKPVGEWTLPEFEAECDAWERHLQRARGVPA